MSVRTLSLARGIRGGVSPAAQRAYLQQAGMVITGVLVARALGPDGRGHLAEVSAVGGLLGGLAAFGIEYTAAAMWRRSPALRPATRRLLLGRILLALLIVAPATAAWVAIVGMGDPTIAGPVLVALIAATVIARAGPAAVLRANGRSTTLATARLISIVPYAAAAGLAFLVPGMAWWGVALGWVAGASASAAWLLAAALRDGLRGRVAERLRPGLAAIELRRAARTVAGSLAAGDLAALDLVVFAIVAPPPVLGTYAACRAFSSLPAFVAQAASPHLGLDRSRRPTLPASLLGATGLAAAAGLLLAPLLLGPAFAGVGVPAALAGIAGGVFGARLICSDWLRSNPGRLGRIPPELVGVPVLACAGLVAGDATLLVIVWGASQAAQLAAVLASARSPRMAA